MAFRYIRLSSTKLTYLDNSGLPAIGYKVWTCEPGTSTATTTWVDRDGVAENTNPIVLDARGQANVFVSGQVKLILCLPTSTAPTDSVIQEDDWLGDELENFVSGVAVPTTLNNNYVVNPSPAVGSLTNNMMLVMTPDVDNQDTLVSTVFTGTGFNDLIASGPYLGTTAGSIFTVQIDSVTQSIDTYIKLLLHCDGTGGAFVDSSVGVKTVTTNGSASQSTAQSVFGGKSGLFSIATSDYLSLADSDDWYLGTGNFTLSMFVRFSSVVNSTLISQQQDANNCWYFDYNGGALRFFYKDASVTRADYTYNWTPTVDTWYYLELVRSSSDLYLFIGSVGGTGTLVTWSTTSTAISTNSLGNITGTLNIGYGPTTGTYFSGYIDELVFSKGIARHTATGFNIQTQEWTATSVDTVKWKKDGGAWTSNVPITAVLQYMTENVGFTFAVKTGHTLGDLWAITVMTPARVNLSGLGNLLIYKNKNGVIVAIDGGDMKAGYPAQLIMNQATNGWLLMNAATPTLTTPSISATRYRLSLIDTHTLSVAEQGWELSCVGTFDINLLPCSQFANKFFYVTNAGTGVITVVASGSEQIFGIGDSDFILGPGSSAQFQTNGVDWHVLTLNGGYRLAAKVTVATPQTSQVISGLNPNIRYQLVVQCVSPEGSGQLYLQFNGDTGSNYSYTWNNVSGYQTFDSRTSMQLTDSISANLSNFIVADIWADSTNHQNTLVMARVNYCYTLPTRRDLSLSGMYNGAADLSSITFGIDTARTFTGTLYLYIVG